MCACIAVKILVSVKFIILPTVLQRNVRTQDYVYVYVCMYPSATWCSDVRKCPGRDIYILCDDIYLQ